MKKPVCIGFNAVSPAEQQYLIEEIEGCVVNLVARVDRELKED